jgi:acetyl esterase
LDSSRIAVGGDSAGANFAAVVARKAGDSANLRLQALIYPVTDATMSGESYRTAGEGYVLTTRHMEWYLDLYLPAGVDRRHPDVSPLFAPSLAGLPPALVLTAECDPLRDEGEAYAERLRAEGVPVVLKRYSGAIHGFFAMSGITEMARDAVSEVALAVRVAVGLAG